MEGNVCATRRLPWGESGPQMAFSSGQGGTGEGVKNSEAIKTLPKIRTFNFFLLRFDLLFWLWGSVSVLSNPFATDFTPKTIEITIFSHHS